MAFYPFAIQTKTREKELRNQIIVQKMESNDVRIVKRNRFGLNHSQFKGKISTNIRMALESKRELFSVHRAKWNL